MKNLLITCALTLTLQSLVTAAPIYHGSFPDAVSTDPPAGWTGTGTNPVTSGSLNYPGLVASTGNQWSVSGTANYNNAFTLTPIAVGETWYYSFLFRMDDLSLLSTTGHTSNLILLSSSAVVSTGVSSFGVLKDADNSSAYNLVFDGDFRGPASTSVKDPNLIEYTEGQTLLMVASYTRAATGTTTSNFWVNPGSLGAGSAPMPYITDLANATRAVNSLLINAGSGATTRPGFTIDEFRVGATWADVTPVPEPATAVMLGLTGLGFALFRRKRTA